MGPLPGKWPGVGEVTAATSHYARIRSSATWHTAHGSWFSPNGQGILHSEARNRTCIVSAAVMGWVALTGRLSLLCCQASDVHLHIGWWGRAGTNAGDCSGKRNPLFGAKIPLEYALPPDTQGWNGGLVWVWRPARASHQRRRRHGLLLKGQLPCRAADCME